MARSTGRSTGLRKVRSPAKTRVIYPPSGRVMRITITLNSAIWTHPLTVMASPLEPLGIDQRIDEIDHDHDGHDRAEDVIEQHAASHSLTGEYIEDGSGKEAGTGHQEHNIEHGGHPTKLRNASAAVAAATEPEMVRAF